MARIAGGPLEHSVCFFAADLADALHQITDHRLFRRGPVRVPLEAEALHLGLNPGFKQQRAGAVEHIAVIHAERHAGINLDGAAVSDHVHFRSALDCADIHRHMIEDLISDGAAVFALLHIILRNTDNLFDFLRDIRLDVP
ncbi:hypothetical protein D3C73_1246810 [compost metagenome]